jgi:sugar O-acyltransferase (sialic acid O-acetyltransferase NeuD family)
LKNLIIIGAGGMGRDIYEFSTQCVGYGKDFTVGGFLDDDLDSLRPFSGYPVVINKIDEYDPAENDVFVCSMGDVSQKKSSVERVLRKGGKFISLIHPTAHIGMNSQIGDGCIILKDAFVGSECSIGDFVLIQIGAVIGHDVRIGKYSRVDCHAVCVGGTELKNGVTIHTGAIINHNVVVENQGKVGAGSFVIRRVKANTSVLGNPAKRI